MAGTITGLFTKANCDTPGVYGQKHLYSMHSAGLCHLAAWLPAPDSSGHFTDRGVVVFVGGEGWGHSPGWNQITGVINDNPKFLALAQRLNAEGWVVVSIDYPAAGSNFHSIDGSDPGPRGSFRMAGTWDEVTPIALWPEQPGYVALAVQYIRDNWCGIDGPNITPFGKKLVGVGNSINPNKVLLAGHKFGASMALYTAMIPTGLYLSEPGVGHGSMDLYTPRSTHGVIGVIALDPCVDWTQVHIDPGYTSPAGSIFQHGHLPTFARCEDRRPWEELEGIWKRECAYFLALEGHPEVGELVVLTEFSGTGTGDPLWDANLGTATWRPGFTADDTAHGKAWIQLWDARLQAEPWRALLAGYGDNASAPIRQSVVRWAGSTKYPLLTTEEFVDETLGLLVIAEENGG
jgi:hypothetical protein